MNILVINGSPKDERSNTLRLTDAFSLDIYKTNGGALSSGGLSRSRYRF